MVTMRSSNLDFNRKGLLSQVGSLPWGLILLICAMAMIGVATLHSATFTNPEEAGLPLRQASRCAAALAILLATGLIPIKWWFRLAWPAYFVTLALLIGVEVFGLTRGGAQRWLQLGPVAVQPSEFMKVTLTLALAAYYHKRLSDYSGGFLLHLPALALIGVPAALIFKQPDFGTTLALFASGGILIFLAGLWWRVIAAIAVAAVASIPPGSRSMSWMMAIRLSRPRLPSVQAVGPARDTWRARNHSSTIFQSSIQISF